MWEDWAGVLEQEWNHKYPLDVVIIVVEVSSVLQQSDQYFNTDWMHLQQTDRVGFIKQQDKVNSDP